MSFTKFYIDNSDKLLKRKIPDTETIPLNFFLGTFLSTISVRIVRNVLKEEARIFCSKICDGEIKEVCQEDKEFVLRTKGNKNLVCIHTSEKTTFNVLGLNSNNPFVESIKTIVIDKNSLIIIPNHLKKSIKDSNNYLLYCFGDEGVENFKFRYDEIINNTPKVITCYLENLRKLGFNEIKDWERSNVEKNLYIGRTPPIFITDESGKKSRMKLNGSISPLAVPKPIHMEKDKNRDRYEILYSNYLDALFNKNIISIDYLWGKTLGCWCKTGEKCSCSIIIEKYKEKTLLQLIGEK